MGFEVNSTDFSRRRISLHARKKRYLTSSRKPERIMGVRAKSNTPLWEHLLTEKVSLGKQNKAAYYLPVLIIGFALRAC